MEKICLALALCVGSVVLVGTRYRLKRKRIVETPKKQDSDEELEIYELKGKFYQVLGHTWDHEVGKFKVVYRPLYTCPRKPGRFEAHQLASSHFSRFESKFRRIHGVTMTEQRGVLTTKLPPEARRFLLPGPFVASDPDWTHPMRTHPLGLDPVVCRLERSHESPRIEHVLGEVGAFVDRVHAALCMAGLDAVEQGYEMDHVCFRCSTTEQYLAILKALTPNLGKLLVESMIGGRPIATVRLHKPFLRGGYSVSCVEVPCPKPGRPYAPGLEHAELVIGTAADGCVGSETLQRFMANCRTQQLPLADRFDERSIGKLVNADVSVSFDDDTGMTSEEAGKKGQSGFSVKFHQQPLYEVIEYEIAQQLVVPVPPGYFDKFLG